MIDSILTTVLFPCMIGFVTAAGIGAITVGLLRLLILLLLFRSICIGTNSFGLNDFSSSDVRNLLDTFSTLSMLDDDDEVVE